MNQKILSIIGMLVLLHVMCWGIELLTSGFVPALKWLLRFERWLWRTIWEGLGELVRSGTRAIARLFG